MTIEQIQAKVNKLEKQVDEVEDFDEQSALIVEIDYLIELLVTESEAEFDKIEAMMDSGLGVW